ncbi:alpha/beta fold hydrolase [Streptomyces sp. NPDC008150]|uniref:alpha/beta hydrolase family protein n=1 Tax=Streptomyces sp. NPDC008150 TaxID=3364816 RepID=UPI0036E3D42F
MAAPEHVPSPGVRRTTLDAGSTRLSALICVPADTAPRATVVALHGGGTGAAYFDGRAHPALSLLTLGARLGYAVVALDRPGYGSSAAALPEGQCLAEQVTTVTTALEDLAARHDVGAGLFLLAHSYGGSLALTAAAGPAGPGYLGVDVSGCGHRFAPGTGRDGGGDGRGGGRAAHWKKYWGPLRLYPDGTFSSGGLMQPMPPRESDDTPHWPDRFPHVAARVRTPVRLTFAEHEQWWCHDDDSLGEIAALFVNAPRVVVERHLRAGHNISLGATARAYHLKALAFLEECLAAAPVPAAAER